MEFAKESSGRTDQKCACSYLDNEDPFLLNTLNALKFQDLEQEKLLKKIMSVQNNPFFACGKLGAFAHLLEIANLLNSLMGEQEQTTTTAARSSNGQSSCC